MRTSDFTKFVCRLVRCPLTDDAKLGVWGCASWRFVEIGQTLPAPSAFKYKKSPIDWAEIHFLYSSPYAPSNFTATCLRSLFKQFILMSSFIHSIRPYFSVEEWFMPISQCSFFNHIERQRYFNIKMTNANSAWTFFYNIFISCWSQTKATQYIIMQTLYCVSSGISWGIKDHGIPSAFLLVFILTGFKNYMLPNSRTQKMET